MARIQKRILYALDALTSPFHCSIKQVHRLSKTLFEHKHEGSGSAFENFSLMARMLYMHFIITYR